MTVKNIMVKLPESEAISLLEGEIKALKKALAAKDRQIHKMEDELAVFTRESKMFADMKRFNEEVREAARTYLDLYEWGEC